MEEKILLVDFDGSGTTGESLRVILEQYSPITVKIEQASDEGPGISSEQPSLDSLIDTYNPALALLIIPLSMRRSERLYRILEQKSFKTALMVAVEADEPDELLKLLRFGVTDFIIPPFNPAEILARIRRVLDHVRQRQEITHELKEKLGLQQLIGASKAFLAEVNKIGVLAKCDAGVLILGETGTGKEMFARAIHYLSPRASRSFIPVNCGAIPSELIENELFGHEKGAFTGAAGPRRGLIDQANGGTLFLDEIDSLPLLSQVKFLRFLQSKEFRSLGALKEQKADVRVIAASNANIEEAVATGKLRRDLYYRLNVIPLRLPPLRERQGDVTILAKHFLANFAAEFDKPVVGFSHGALQVLNMYNWPGNVRELEHVIERAVVLCDQSMIETRDILLPNIDPEIIKQSFQEMKAKIIAQFEKTYIEALLLSYRGNITRAAYAAQKNRRAFWQLIRKHNIDAQQFKENKE